MNECRWWGRQSKRCLRVRWWRQRRSSARRKRSVAHLFRWNLTFSSQRPFSWTSECGNVGIGSHSNGDRVGRAILEGGISSKADSTCWILCWRDHICLASSGNSRHNGWWWRWRWNPRGDEKAFGTGGHLHLGLSTEKKESPPTIKREPLPFLHLSRIYIRLSLKPKSP